MHSLQVEKVYTSIQVVWFVLAFILGLRRAKIERFVGNFVNRWLFYVKIDT